MDNKLKNLSAKNEDLRYKQERLFQIDDINSLNSHFPDKNIKNHNKYSKNNQIISQLKELNITNQYLKNQYIQKNEQLEKFITVYKSNKNNPKCFNYQPYNIKPFIQFAYNKYNSNYIFKMLQ